MEIRHDVEKIYMTLGRAEILIHIPFRVIFENITDRSKNARFFPTGLTAREGQVLSGILDGKSNKEIAQEVNLSVRAIKFHVTNLLFKNKVGSRMQLHGIYANAGGERK